MEPGRVLHARFESLDADELAESLEPVAPGCLIAPTRAGPLSARCELVRTPRVGLFRIGLGDTRVLNTGLRDYYSVTLATDGAFEVVDVTREGHFDSGRAHLLTPSIPLDLRSHAGALQLVASLDAALVEPYFGERPPHADGPHHARLCTDAGAGAGFAALTAELWRAHRTEPLRPCSPASLAESEERLAELLVEAWLGGQLEDEPAERGRLRRAEECLAAQLTQPVSLPEVAAAAGTSVRSLSRAFRESRGVSPMRFLRLRRLDAIQRELLESEPEAGSVTSVAVRYGFAHLGRFSGEYRRCFGEYPSETLARRARTGARARPFASVVADL